MNIENSDIKKIKIIGVHNNLNFEITDKFFDADHIINENIWYPYDKEYKQLVKSFYEDYEVRDNTLPLASF